MKTKGSTGWVLIALVAVVCFMTSCGNSQKKKEQAKTQKTEQAADSEMVMESETIVVEVDSITPDTTAMKQQKNTPKNTK